MSEERPGSWVSFLVDASVDAGDLDRTVQALRAQSTPHWQLLVAGTGLEIPDDDRVVVVAPADDPGLTAQKLLGHATSPYLAVLDSGDEPAAEACEVLAQQLEARADVDVLYTDELVEDPASGEIHTHRKPAWSPERLRGQAYPGRLCAVRRARADEVGGFRAGFGGAHEHDLLLRLSAAGALVLRVPEVLHRSRRTAEEGRAIAERRWDGHVRAVDDHLAQVEVGATARRGPVPGTVTVLRRAAPDTGVTVVVPTQGLPGLVWGERSYFVVEAVSSMLAHAGDVRVQVRVVHTGSTPREVLERLRRLDERVQLVRHDGEVAFGPMCNRGVASGGGPDDFLVLTHDRVVADSDGFLEQLVAPLATGGVGLTGPRLLGADGVHLGAGVARFAHRLEPMYAGALEADAGPDAALAVSRECSAVLPTCFAVSRSTYTVVGGLNERFDRSGHSDLANKVTRLGLTTVWVAHARMRHFPSGRDIKKIPDREIDEMSARWGEVDLDPYAPALGERLQLRLALERLNQDGGPGSEDPGSIGDTRNQRRERRRR
jgi:hypothetical protein